MTELLDLHGCVTGPVFWAALAVLGLAVGVLTGLFGAGGGFILTPLMNVLLGMPYPVAVGSGLAAIIGSSTAALRAHWRCGNVNVRVVLLMAGGCMSGSATGALLLEELRRLLGGEQAKAFILLLHAMFIVLLLAVIWIVLRGRPEQRQGVPPLQLLPIGPHVRLDRSGRSASLPGILSIAFCVGLVTGLLGVGGGVLYMPILVFLMGLSVHQAIGTSLGLVVLSAVAGASQHAWRGNVNLPAVVVLLTGGAVGSQLGAWLCARLHPARLRRYFGLLLAAVAVTLAIDFLRRLR